MTFDRWTRKYLQRLLFGQFLKTSAEWLGAFLLSFGTIVLLVKLAMPSPLAQCSLVRIGGNSNLNCRLAIRDERCLYGR